MPLLVFFLEPNSSSMASKRQGEPPYRLVLRRCLIVFIHRPVLRLFFAGSVPLMSLPSNPADDIQQCIDYYENAPVDHFNKSENRYFSSCET